MVIDDFSVPEGVNGDQGAGSFRKLHRQPERCVPHSSWHRLIVMGNLRAFHVLTLTTVISFLSSLPSVNVRTGLKMLGYIPFSSTISSCKVKTLICPGANLWSCLTRKRGRATGQIPHSASRSWSPLSGVSECGARSILNVPRNRVRGSRSGR